MLYKILLTINSPSENTINYVLAAEKLVHNNWRKLGETYQVWVSEIIAHDLLSAKIRVERDLNLFFMETGLRELCYAFQLSLGEVSSGRLKQNQK